MLNIGSVSRVAASVMRSSLSRPESTRSVIVLTSLKPERVSVPPLMAAATRSGTDLSSRPQARSLMMPVSELT